MRKKAIVCKPILLTVFLASCQFYSKVEPPAPDLHQQYLTQIPPQENGTKQDFFAQFQDEQLVALLKSAFENNADLQEAIERIEEAKSFYGIESAALYPSVQLDLDAQRTRSSKSGFSEIQGTPFAIGVGQNRSIITNIFLGALNLNWEIDFFGKVRNKRLRAQHAIQEKQAFQRSVQLTLAADLATTYYAYGTYQQLIDLTEEELFALKKIQSLVSSRVDEGLNPKQSQTEIEKTIAEKNQHLLELKTSASTFFHHLARLVNQEALDLQLKSIPLCQIQSENLFCQIKLPMELIRSRPDILIAENQLLQAGYSVHVAQSELFPSISILGAFGYASTLFPKWFQYDNAFWSLGPTLRWPVFQGFQYLSEVNVQKSRQKQAALHYHSTVLAALEEVENALVTFFNQEKQVALATVALEKESELYRAQVSLSKNGLDSEEKALFLQIDQIQEEKKKITESFKTIQALIQLYKALGGSWS